MQPAPPLCSHQKENPDPIQPEGWGAVTTMPASWSPRPTLESRNRLLVRPGLPDPVQPSSLVLIKPAQRKAAPRPLSPCAPAWRCPLLSRE